MLKTGEANHCYSLRRIQTLLVQSEDSMAAIWVVFGHLAVISKNGKWSAYNGDLNPGPRLAYQSARPLYHRLPRVYRQYTDSILYWPDRGYRLCIGKVAHLAEAGARSPLQKARHDPRLISSTYSLLGGQGHGCKKTAQHFSLPSGE